jgi:hypothetical protein
MSEVSEMKGDEMKKRKREREMKRKEKTRTSRKKGGRKTCSGRINFRRFFLLFLRSQSFSISFSFSITLALASSRN